MGLLSDVERLMAARMAVRSEARGSGGATAKVRGGLHVLVQARWSATLDGPFREETIAVFRSVAIQNTWSILAGATNNGRLEWVCLTEEVPGNETADSSDQAQLRQTRVSIFLFLFTSDIMTDATSLRAEVYTDEQHGE